MNYYFKFEDIDDEMVFITYEGPELKYKGFNMCCHKDECTLAKIFDHFLWFKEAADKIIFLRTWKEFFDHIYFFGRLNSALLMFAAGYITILFWVIFVAVIHSLV